VCVRPWQLVCAGKGQSRDLVLLAPQTDGVLVWLSMDMPQTLLGFAVCLVVDCFRQTLRLCA
jgi:hypothetical protein